MHMLCEQVGELQKGSGHQSLDFHLCARPDANLDLSKQLEAAGHHVPERCVPYMARGLVVLPHSI